MSLPSGLRQFARRHGRLARQFFVFGVVGGISAIAHFSVLALLVETGMAGPVAGSAAGFVVAATMSYAMNRAFTFNATRGHAEAAWRFAVVATAGFVLNAVLMELFAARLGIYYLLAQLLTTLIVMVSNFLGYRLWAFAHTDAPHER
ncbi:GtrA family protein [Ancylobacter sp. G4_0304]|uniref:GtrA family protein n=1 Tax=Ancylobacter sp. G4_0304 TaxID=3114289 RepID=UPI0039C72BF2